jgi:hypothetical protein
MAWAFLILSFVSSQPFLSSLWSINFMSLRPCSSSPLTGPRTLTLVEWYKFSRLLKHSWVEHLGHHQWFVKARKKASHVWSIKEIEGFAYQFVRKVPDNIEDSELRPWLGNKRTAGGCKISYLAKNSGSKEPTLIGGSFFKPLDRVQHFEPENPGRNPWLKEEKVHTFWDIRSSKAYTHRQSPNDVEYSMIKKQKNDTHLSS